MEKVRKAIEEKQAWYEHNINAQNRRPLTDPPVVFVSQIRSEKDVSSFFSDSPITNSIL